MSPTSESPASVAVLVVDRWNSWVRVLFPDTGDTTWVDLSVTSHQPLPAIRDGGPDPRGRDGRRS